jgi:hypothetical protein
MHFSPSKGTEVLLHKLGEICYECRDNSKTRVLSRLIEQGDLPQRFSISVYTLYMPFLEVS